MLFNRPIEPSMSILEDLLTKDPSFQLNSQYKNISKLTNGSFSDIFTAETIGKQTAVIIKAPHKTPNSYAEISKEAIILLKLKELKTVPRVLYLQADSNCEVLVLEKLGVSLETMKQEHNNFSLKTTILLGCQLLTIIEDIHNNGILHRDVKPSNILIGEGLNKNQIYLIDFDIATTFSSNGQKVPETANEFVGTKAFASRNAHKCGQFSRKDDLESLGFTLIYLYQGKLPWTSMKCDLLAMGNVKDQFMKGSFLAEFPKEFQLFFDYLDKMKLDDIPDYQYLRNLFNSMADRFGFNLENWQFEWMEEETGNNLTWIENPEEKKEELDREDEIGSDDSTTENSVQNKVFCLNKTFNQKFFGEIKMKRSFGFMQGFKEAFMKGQAQSQQ